MVLAMLERSLSAPISPMHSTALTLSSSDAYGFEATCMNFYKYCVKTALSLEMITAAIFADDLD
jgi:hypothetical protein